MESYTLISGASSGIGAGMARMFSENRRIILTGRSLEKLESVRQECHNPQQHLIWCCDLATDRNNIFHSLSSFLEEKNAVVDEFIHCAGVTKILPLRNFEPSYVDDIFNTNVFSAIEILRVLLKRVNKKALRNVIFISGLWSIRGERGNSIYAASKGTLNSLVYSLAQELAPQVRVNSVVPGALLTPMTELSLQDESVKQRIDNDYPLGIGTIEDVVNYTAFLLSDKARWITGQNMVIDGGRSTK